jgi:hypothetical protein
MKSMMKSKTDMLRRMVRPRRMLRGTTVSLDDCGVPRAALLHCLRQTELFSNVPDALADLILEAMVVRRLREGAVLFREGARGDSILLKAAGAVRISQLRPDLQESRVLATLTDPAVLGQEAFYGVEKRSVTARMMTSGTVLHLRRGEFADLVSKHFVKWCEADKVPKEKAYVLWVGVSRSRPRSLAGVPCARVSRVKRHVQEAAPGQPVYCCAKDDATAAFAAFLLEQRGQHAVAVRQGRKLSVAENSDQRE